MAAISNDGSNWKQEAIEKASVISDRWDVLMAWLGHFAVPVLMITMFVSIAGMFPGVHYPEWVSSAILLTQVIFLDIGGLSLKTLAQQAHDKGQEQAALKGQRMSTFLIALLITTLALVTVNQLAPVAGPDASKVIKQVASYLDMFLILVRVISIVLYLNVVHDLKEHSALAIQPTQPPTQPIQNGRIDELAKTVKDLESMVKMLSERQPTQPPIQVVEVPTHDLYTPDHDLYNGSTGPQVLLAQYTNQPVQEKKLVQAAPASQAKSSVPTQIVYPVVPGVSDRKVKEILDAVQKGTTWRELPGNYSQTIKPVREAWENLHKS